jgi:hypothetical protein
MELQRDSNLHRVCGFVETFEDTERIIRTEGIIRSRKSKINRQHKDQKKKDKKYKRSVLIILSVSSNVSNIHSL